MAFPFTTATREVRALLLTEVVAVWQSLGYPRSSMALEGERAESPSDGYWIEVTTGFGFSQLAVLGGVGSGQNLKGGALFLTLNGPLNKGTRRLDEIAGAFFDHLERKTFGGVYVFGGVGPTAGAAREWASVQVSMNFQYWEQR